MRDSLGVLGLGRMGLPIAIRLAERWPTAAFDPAVSAPAGIRQATDARSLAASVDVLVTVLPGRAELADAAPGILESLRAGTTWLDLTSGDPLLADQTALAAAAREVTLVCAPMGGGPSDAAAGSLTLFVGGPAAAVDRVRPILDALGNRVELAGPKAGDGLAVKLIVNLLWFGQAAAVTEAALLAKRLGIDEGVVRTVLPRSAAGSRFLDDYLDPLLAGDPVATFGIARVVEELDTLEMLADGGVYELSAVVTRLHREALDRFGAVDGELLVAKLLNERAGRLNGRLGD